MFINARFFLLFLMALCAQMCQESVARRCSIKTRDQQCKEVYPHSHGFCEPTYVFLHLTPDESCKKMYCAFEYRRSFYSLHHPVKTVDGTACGPMSECHGGECRPIENPNEKAEYEGVEGLGYECLPEVAYNAVRRRYHQAE